MSDYKITCSRCEAPVTHECRRWRDRDEDGNTVWRDDLRGEAFHPNPLVHAFIELLIWKPEGGLPEHTVEAMKQSDWYDAGDEDAPFFSQAVLYPLLDWKDNARTLFSLLFSILTAAGIDHWEVKRLAHKVSTERDAEEAATSGGILGVAAMEQVDFLPGEGWTAGLTAHGVGVVPARITKATENKRGDRGPRGPWDCWVSFDGGGRCHFRRLLRVAHWIKDAEGKQVWPPTDDS